MMKNLFDITGKVAAVIGAAGGLGRVAVKAYLDSGAKVAALDLNGERLSAMADEAKADGYELLTAVCDVSSEETVNAAMKQVMDTYGQVDILLNNAGVALGARPESPLEMWDKCMDINLRGQWLAIRSVLPGMMERHSGKIINVSSINAFVGMKQFPLLPYCASKAGSLGLTRSLAAFYSQYGININAICPGLFLTEMIKDWPPEMLAAYNQITPMGRAGTAEELAGTIIYLSSEASAYVTGEHIMVDGGAKIV